MHRLKTQGPELELLQSLSLQPMVGSSLRILPLPTELWTVSANGFVYPLRKPALTIKEEWDDMLEYSKRYLNLVQEVIWWKLFCAADAKKYVNVSAVIELLFWLPIANGRVERVFSQLKMIKNNRHTCLHENTLNQPLRINVEGPNVDWNCGT